MNSNKKEYTNISIKEMNDLVHIRGVGVELAPRVNKWLNDVGGDRMREYDKLLNTYFKELYQDAPKEGPPRYWFELLECGSQYWEIFSMRRHFWRRYPNW